jgi:hypothetical protein
MNAQILALKPAGNPKEKEDDVLIHVRYHPNADVSTIDACPKHLSPKAWLALLWTEAPSHYLGLSGGRGFFRIPRSAYEAILSKA